MAKTLTPRARATYNRKESCATLSTPDRQTTVQIKLCSDGVIAIGVYRPGKTPVHRELGPQVNYND